MIKRISILLVIALFIGVLSSAAAGTKAKTNIKSATLQVDINNTLFIDFTKARVRVEGWDKEYAEITPSLSLNDEEYEKDYGYNYKIIQDNNTIKLEGYSRVPSTTYNLQTWFPLVQFGRYKKELSNGGEIGVGMNSVLEGYDFLIRVPKGMASSIKADTIKAIGCTVVYTKAGNTILRESNIVKGFVSEGSRITVRDCTINHDSSFNNKVLEMRDNKFVKG